MKQEDEIKSLEKKINDLLKQDTRGTIQVVHYTPELYGSLISRCREFEDVINIDASYTLEYMISVQHLGVSDFPKALLDQARGFPIAIIWHLYDTLTYTEDIVCEMDDDFDTNLIFMTRKSMV